ncbi:hypothetical protein CL656_01635 [bacterium]|nr:hypothetical protein [bacterium]|tara:strand:+ start:296 stop:832 length:537 start_codon:yes stop_codon:yes gene_type:complete
MDTFFKENIKVETIETSLYNNDENSDNDEFSKYDYKCSFKEYFGLIELIVPNQSMKYNMEKYYIHKNIVVLIIESMAIGIVMNLHLAQKFKYIDNVIEYKDYSVIFEDGMKIIKISTEWDTSRWSYYKIKDFYNWFDAFHIENSSCSKLEERFQKMMYESSPDIEFLSSLCWNTHLTD